MSTWHDQHRRTPAPGFGTLLTTYRQARGWSMSELARRAGLDHSYISRLEAGDRMPARVVACELADVFGLHNVDRDVFLATAGFWPDELAIVPSALLGYRAAVDGIEDIETEAA